jgi:hypothetical protein
MTGPAKCEECEAIRSQLRGVSSELWEVWGKAVSQVGQAAQNDTEEILDELLEKYEFRPGSAPQEPQYPGIARAVHKMFQHQIRTGHNPLVRK